MSNKKGRMTREIENYIADNYTVKTLDELAEETGYSRRGIRAFVKRIGLADATKIDDDVKHELYRKPWWPEIRQQLLEEEVPSFIWKWASLQRQFDNDVLASEEMQMCRMIIVQILQARCIAQQTHCIKTARELEDQLALERNSGGDPSRIAELQKMITENKTAANNYLLQSDKLSRESDNLFAALKARREDRIKTIQDASKSFSTALEMLEDEEIRKRLGMEIHLLQLAQQNAKRKLMQVHTFVDGRDDFPMLSYETFLETEEKKDEE